MKRCRIVHIEKGCGVDYRGVPFVNCPALTDVKMKSNSGIAEAAVDLGRCYIDSFYAKPRGRGIGSSCVPVLLDWMKKEGCTKARLVHSEGLGEEEGIEDTRGFWETMGFNLVARTPEERLQYGHAEMEMKLD